MYTMKQLTEAFNVTAQSLYDFIKKMPVDFVRENKVQEGRLIKYTEEFYQELAKHYQADKPYTAQNKPLQDASVDELREMYLQSQERARAQEKAFYEQRIADLEKRITALEDDKQQLQQQIFNLQSMAQLDKQLELVRSKKLLPGGHKKGAVLVSTQEEEQKPRRGLFHRKERKS